MLLKINKTLPSCSIVYLQNPKKITTVSLPVEIMEGLSHCVIDLKIKKRKD